jgi:hypothetical protein
LIDLGPNPMPTFVAFAPVPPETPVRPRYWAGAFAVSLMMWAFIVAGLIQMIR